jgi:hypothetical protein
MSSYDAREQLDNWVSDFTLSDALRPFSPATRDLAASILLAFLTAACDARGITPSDIEEPDARAALLGPVARLALPDAVRGEVPSLCGAFLASLEAEGRLAGGRATGAFVQALKPKFLEEASGKTKPIVNPGSKLGRNDPCPCGSGKKFKKCCARE